MKTSVYCMAVLLLVIAPIAKAQNAPTDSERFVSQFPSLKALEMSLKEDVESRPAEEIESNLGHNAVHVGRWAVVDSVLLDNLKVHIDGTYSDTLQESLGAKGQMLPGFQLTGVKFIPTGSLTYEMPLGQMTRAHRPWRSGSGVQQDRDAAYEKDLVNLHMAFAQFEESRAEFLSQSVSQNPQVAFYKLKEQAIAVLALAHYSKETEDAWMSAEFSAPHEAKIPARIATMKH